MLKIPLAYKYVVIAAMTSQVNYFAPRLHLPIDVPVKERDIRFLNVTKPITLPNLLFYGGRLQVKNYSFTFGPNLESVTKLEDDGMDSFGIPLLKPNEGQNSLMERASLMKYIVSTNDLYQVATNYLVALGIDRQAFEKTNTLAVEQGDFHSKRGLVPSPLIHAYWGKPELRGPHFNGFSFEISAVSGELLELDVGSGLTIPLIKDLDRLLAISDEEFLKYSAEERSNLVARFSAIVCPPSTNQPHILPSHTDASAKANVSPH